MLSAIVVAAGSSRRMGFDKLLADLHGRPVVVHAVEAFQRCQAVREILVVASAGREEEFRVLLGRENFSKACTVLTGGAERHLSVWKGLCALDPSVEFVAVHDGARPLVTPGLIERCLESARSGGAAAVAVPVADTLKRVDAVTGRVVGGVDRTHLWAMQTPQIFAAALLRRAYEAVLASGDAVTDEVSAVERLGEPVTLVNAGKANFKITYPRDLDLARLVLAARQQTWDGGSSEGSLKGGAP